MCEPTTLILGATALAAAGSVYAGVNAYQQGNFQGKVARRNAEMANASARDALDRGRQDSVLQGRRSAQLRGAQNAALAASGIDLGFGSAMDLVGDTAMIGSEDAAAIRENAIRESKGFSISASNYLSQGRAAKAAGKAALIGSVFDAGSSILGGAAQADTVAARRLSQNAGSPAGKWGDVFTTRRPTFAAIPAFGG